MNELVEKHDIEPGFYIYLQRNSLVWLARFKVEGKWISRTTKERDKTKAPDGHPKLLHFWPVKLLQAGRSDYDDSCVMAMRAAASLSR